MIAYDPAKVSYDALLDMFWKEHAPYPASRQYRSAIFVHDESQRALAERVQARLLDEGKRAVAYTAIEDAGPFYRAEEYHQHFIHKQRTYVAPATTRRPIPP
mmetsp:Transcript_32497/g.103624  ORF Transcript_32497/g.103624 Transcript_32497/m.103624 type:complete len:102 (+) Transcript_32497:283-588(+)